MNKRVLRKDLTASYFHVITQGINKNIIFNESIDIKYYIKIMYELNKEYKINIIAYCVMNNHTHMLVKIENTNELSRFMQRLNTKYGIYYNKKYNRVGYVFRDRYKAEMIRDEKHLYNCEKYIYNNPVKAGICMRPDQYPYSNYKRVEMNDDENYIFIDIDNDKKEFCNKIINDFLHEKKMNLDYLKKDKQTLKELILILKDKYNFSLRKISEILKLGRETTRKLYNSINK